MSAVYTRFTPRQLVEISEAIGSEIGSTWDITAGTNDSKFRANIDPEDPDAGQVVITIHETPDINSNGMPQEVSRLYPLLVSYMAGKIGTEGILDRFGQVVKFSVPTPYMFYPGTDQENPFTTMEFLVPGGGSEPVAKTVSIAPFIEGKEIEYEDGVCMPTEVCHMLGRAHAAWQRAAEGFPLDIENPFGRKRWVQVANKIRDAEGAAEKLGQIIKRDEGHAPETEQYDDAHWTQRGQELIDDIVMASHYIDMHWGDKIAELPIIIINGDTFPDNGKRDPNGDFVVVDNGTAGRDVNLDIAMGLNASCTNHGVLSLEHAREYMRGWNEVQEITPELNRAIPFLAMASALRWALTRAELIIDPPSKGVVNMRSPMGSMTQYRHWSTLETFGITIDFDGRYTDKSATKENPAKPDQGHARS